MLLIANYYLKLSLDIHDGSIPRTHMDDKNCVNTIHWETNAPLLSDLKTAVFAFVMKERGSRQATKQSLFRLLEGFTLVQWPSPSPEVQRTKII